MRKVTGEIVLPATISKMKADVIVIEVRDVSMMDVSSTIIAEQRLKEVMLEPNGSIHFELQTPEVESNRSLALRVHISIDGSGQVKAGDLLTMLNYPVPTSGTVSHLEVTPKPI